MLPGSVLAPKLPVGRLTDHWSIYSQPGCKSGPLVAKYGPEVAYQKVLQLNWQNCLLRPVLATKGVFHQKISLWWTVDAQELKIADFGSFRNIAVILTAIFGILAGKFASSINLSFGEEMDEFHPGQTFLASQESPNIECPKPLDCILICCQLVHVHKSCM